jgi:hypothetical protein
MSGAWVVKMVWWVGGWCVVCIGKVVENGVVMVCEKTNGRCELQSSMKHDKLGNIRMFCAHEEKSLFGV